VRDFKSIEADPSYKALLRELNIRELQRRRRALPEYGSEQKSTRARGMIGLGSGIWKTL
jgi:hypothetical protein